MSEAWFVAEREAQYAVTQDDSQLTGRRGE
jgi:hypothetical protein